MPYSMAEAADASAATQASGSLEAQILELQEKLAAALADNTKLQAANVTLTEQLQGRHSGARCVLGKRQACRTSANSLLNHARISHCTRVHASLALSVHGLERSDMFAHLCLSPTWPGFTRHGFAPGMCAHIGRLHA